MGSGLLCDGSHGSPCQQSKTIPINGLPEGRHTYQLKVLDAIWNESPMVWWEARIDRSPPGVDPPTGSLVTNKDAINPFGSYELKVAAFDGNTDVPAHMRSGVKQIEIWDGDHVYRPFEEQSCDATNGSCRMPLTGELTWSIPPGTFSVGQHVLRIVATDQVGLTSDWTAASTVTIQVQEDTTDPQVSLSTEPTAADGTTVLHMNAVDPGPIASGVSGLGIYIDGEQVQWLPNSCTAAGCGMDSEFTLSASQNPQTTRVTVMVDDRADNGDLSSKGPPDPHYDNFGYNDDWLRRIGDRHIAADGGGTTIRVGINWCEVQRFPGAISWGPYKAMFDAIAGFNENHDGDDYDISVIAIPWDSPTWANGMQVDGPGDCTNDANTFTMTPPTDLAAWETFVGEFVKRWGPNPPAPNENDDYGLIAVEAWNEPNLSDFWLDEDYPTGGDPKLFAELVNRASQGVRANSDGVKVLAGGLSPTGTTDERDYLQRATNCANDLPCINENLVNGIGVHLYANDQYQVPPTRRRLKGQYEQINLALPDRFEDTKRWITEIGFPTGPTSGQNPTNQRKRIEMAYELFRKDRIPTFIVHRLREQNEHQRYALFPEDGDSPKGGADGAYCRLAELRNVDPPSGC